MLDLEEILAIVGIGVLIGAGSHYELWAFIFQGIVGLSLMIPAIFKRRKQE